MTSCLAPYPKLLKVVVADGERLIADTLVLILNQSGFHATAAYTGKDAVSLAFELRPQILICDASLCDLDGVEVAFMVRSTLPHCKLLLFSTHPDIQELSRKA